MPLNRDNFVTSRGTTAIVEHTRDFRPPNRDAVASSFRVTTPSSGTANQVDVVFGQPPMIDRNLRDHVGIKFDSDTRQILGVSAILDAVECEPGFLDEKGQEELFVGAEDALGLFTAGRSLSNRELRRYIARRAYSHFTHNDLRTPFSLDEVDQLHTGASYSDFRRNLQVLVEEDYLEPVADGALERGGPVRATARLVREVEEFGAAESDATSRDEYEDRLTEYPRLEDREADFLRERRRYEKAQTAGDLVSVFRALAPLVESTLRDLLRAHGVERELPSLGPMIAVVQNRGIGDRALKEELNHVLKFARDLAQHGRVPSEAVLRIACENAFDLAPRLGALYPDNSQ